MPVVYLANHNLHDQSVGGWNNLATEMILARLTTSQGCEPGTELFWLVSTEVDCPHVVILLAVVNVNNLSNKKTPSRKQMETRKTKQRLREIGFARNLVCARIAFD